MSPLADLPENEIVIKSRCKLGDYPADFIEYAKWSLVELYNFAVQSGQGRIIDGMKVYRRVDELVHKCEFMTQKFFRDHIGEGNAALTADAARLVSSRRGPHITRSTLIVGNQMLKIAQEVNSKQQQYALAIQRAPGVDGKKLVRSTFFKTEAAYQLGTVVRGDEKRANSQFFYTVKEASGVGQYCMHHFKGIGEPKNGWYPVVQDGIPANTSYRSLG